MLKVYVVAILPWLLSGLAVGETKVNEKVYYKHTPTAAVEDDHVTKYVGPIIMEGQPPSTSVKLNSVKINSINDVVVKKESKTVPRKGALNKSDENDDQNSTLKLNTPLDESSNTSTVILETNKKIIANLPKISTSNDKASTLHIAPVKEEPPKQEVVSDPVTTKTVKKPKPKPEVTVGGKEADEPIPASPTSKSPLGMPGKIDYIVPVVITITALPLLGVAFYVLYKRGRDYWDKRHYRRMDFLIDGMYNE